MNNNRLRYYRWLEKEEGDNEEETIVCSNGIWVVLVYEYPTCTGWWRIYE